VRTAVKSSGIPREEVIITSQVWNSDQGYDRTLSAFGKSLKLLGLDYLDLYLIHWPVAGKFKDTWKALELLYRKGMVRSIGVSNFLIHHLDDLLEEARVIPAVNQIEFHPYLIQQELLDYCNDNKILVEAWSPLMQGKFSEIGLFAEIGDSYQKTPAQVLLRWHLQRGVITIPKSVNKSRIRENASIFDFSLSDEEMHLINELDKDRRFGPDPDNFDF
jgi:diketogulonate reductase-like aldo/keto reductase